MKIAFAPPPPKKNWGLETSIFGTNIHTPLKLKQLV